ncbi:T9SS type A sorting domain-containing protein [bacterium]|nr:T9SS type A sorting domain-containing protein [bacterium]MBU1983036.1 T9SS type A sorting domain-containing protein [bacterium]
MKTLYRFLTAGMLMSASAFTPVASAQPPDTLWTRTYGSASEEECNEVIQTTDGGFLLVGSAASNMWLVKTNANGDWLWHSTNGGDQADVGVAVLQTGDSEYLVGGTTSSYGNGWEDWWMVKVEGSGYVPWHRTFGDTLSDILQDIQPTDDGGYVLAGLKVSYPNGYDMWVVKTDMWGYPVWDQTFGSANTEWAFAVEQTSDGGYVVAGLANNGANALLVKTDANGDSLWSRIYDLGRQFRSVHQTGDGGFILAGVTNSAGQSDFWLLKTNSNGDLQWSRTYGGSGDDVCFSMQPTADGGYVLAGWTVSFGAGGKDWWVVKTDANGDSLWSQAFGGLNHDVCNSVQQTDDGGYVLAGYTNSFGAGGADMWLVRLETELGAGEPERAAVRHFELHDGYPNPFNATITISFDVPKTSAVKLEVFDVTGRRVAVLADGVYAAGEHRYVFDASGLPSGVYLYRLQAEGFAQTKKMVLLK